ncbi:hypothetical protein [uncultured Clostridium sp.]|uniref:hypothetical protein n=1 Tax=uncultured Clostridium sp. TaxID=59620 RepID=UPI0028E1DB58|nr:hypothetical protein [uncultured Clostridium sp.]
MELSIIPFICEGFSTNPKIYKLIDDLYKKNKLLFYQSAKNSPWYAHQMAMEGSLEQEEYFKKSLGIILNMEKYNDEIVGLIEKGWRYVYIYNQNHARIIFEEFFKSFIKKNNGLDNINDDELNSNLNMLIALAANKIDTSTTLYRDYTASLIHRMNHYNNDNPSKINLNKATKEDLKKIREIRTKLINEFGDLKNLSNMAIHKTSLKDYFTTIDFIYDYEKISLVSIANDIKFTDRDIDEILYLWILAFNDNMAIADIGKFVLDMVRIKYLCKAYKKAKEYHFENNKETMYLELELLQRNLNSQKEEKLILQNDKNELMEKISQLEKENSRLKDSLQKSNESQNELIALREFAFKQAQQVSDIFSNENVDLEKLNQINALILGGSDKWQHKMKELLPGFKFIGVDALNFDKRLLDDIEIIFIYTDYLNHALYYKLMSIAKDKKIVYLKSNINQDIVLNQISDSIK